MDISVIICCYNSKNKIVSTLEHIANQSLGSLRYEVIIVDNNCTDSTVETAINFWETLGTPFELRIIKEIQPGLSFARKRGVFEAIGEIIVFCDDDNWLNKGYIKTAFEIMQNNMSIGVLAGQSRAVSDIDIPTWFYTYYGNYACGVLSTRTGDISSRLWVWGAGMVVRKSIMEKLYLKYTHTTKDRTKDSMESGGDVEICYWHILEDKKLWYDDRLMLDHFMPSERLTLESAEKQFIAQDKSSNKLRALADLTSSYFDYREGKMSLKTILTDFIRLKLRSGLKSSRYFIKFKKSL